MSDNFMVYLKSQKSAAKSLLKGIHFAEIHEPKSTSINLRTSQV